MAPVLSSHHRRPFSPQFSEHHEDDKVHDNDDISHVFILSKYKEIINIPHEL
jgi:hypothetical protein